MRRALPVGLLALALLAWGGLGGYFTKSGARSERGESVREKPSRFDDVAEPQRLNKRPHLPSPVPLIPMTAGVVEGRVVDEEERGIDGVQVFATRQGEASVGTTVSRGGGRFAFELRPGGYSFHALDNGRASERTKSLLVSPGGKLDGVVLVLGRPASLALTVRDATNGQTLGQCVVATVDGFELGQCDHGGRVRVLTLPRGASAVRVSADGYVPLETSVVLGHKGHTSADVALHPGARLDGRVTDPDGRPVADAHVWTEHYALGGPAPASTRTTTDARGVFLLNGVSPGRVTVKASSPGWAQARSPELVLTSTQRPPALELVLTTGGAIAGRVLDGGGEPVAGVRVEASRPGAERVESEDQSSVDGSYRLDGLEPGAYTVVASALEGQALKPGVEVSAREEHALDLVLVGRSISGRVREGGHGAGVGGAWVRAVPLSAGGMGGREVATDSMGDFVLSGLAGESYVVVAQAEGLGAAEARGVEPGERVELVLEGQGTLQGVVSSNAGFVSAAFEITLAPDGPVPDGGMAGRYRVVPVLSPDGTFVVEGLPVGRYRVRARAEEHLELQRVVDIGAGATVELSLRLERGVDVEGTVRNEGVPVEGCRVMGRATSRPDGSFRVGGLMKGGVFVWVRCPDGTGGGARVDVSDGGVRGVEIAVRPMALNSDGADFGGIGASLQSDANARIVVAGVFEGGPAFRAGIQRGDEILSVDGWGTTGHSVTDVVARIRGPIGAPVVLGIRRHADGSVTRAVAERSRIALQ